MAIKNSMLVVGVDVGGTFTDIVCSDGSRTWKAKSPTIPDNFSEGVLNGCTLVASQMETTLEQMLARVERFGLGTTAVTNVLATQQGMRVGLLTTAGFEKHLHLARGARINVEGWLEMPWNPVRREDVVGINERTNQRGEILQPLNVREVEQALTLLVNDHEVEAIAVSFLWSCRNSENEAAAVATIRDLFSDLPVFSGVELHPLYREYERTTMAVLNAFTANALDGVEHLEATLSDLGMSVPLLLLHSGGGAMTVPEARQSPLSLASSGPAAGTVAAGEVAKLVDCQDVMACDMGGTSTDVSVVRNGAPERRQQAVVNGLVTGISSVDVESIGAGGGSIAWIDSRNMLRVGPRSARAIPGPVCYGRGGTIPTITDANLVLGYISADSFQSGGIHLDLEAALRACDELGATLGLTGMETAYGIREIAIAEMEKAIMARLATGGHDPRKLSLVSLGGSGSLFVPVIARELRFRSVITSEFASVLSAYGAATADLRYESVHAVDQVYPLTGDFESVLARLRDNLDKQFEYNKVAEEKREFQFEADLRLHRQKASITLPLSGTSADLTSLPQPFGSIYSDRYGEAASAKTTAIELSTLRVVGIGRTVRAHLQSDGGPVEPDVTPDPNGSRQIWIERNNATDTPMFRLQELHEGHVVEGPAVIDTSDTTVWTPPGMKTRVAERRTLITSIIETEHS